MRIGSFFEKVLDFFIDLLTDLFDASKNAIEADAGQYLSLLLTTAAAAVTAAEQTGGSGSEKWDAAKKVVMDTMTGAGADLLETTIDTVIQNNVMALKADLDEALRPSPPQTTE